MSEQVETSGRRPLLLYAWIVVPVVVLVGLGVMTFFKRGTGPDVKLPPVGPHTQDVPLIAVRNSLAQQNDLSRCRSAIAQANAHLQHLPAEQRPQPLPSQQAERLRAELGLDDADLAEMNSTTFTTLDAAHVESCFLLRDAARSLEVVPPAGRGGKPVKPTPLERARLAFEWVCRQVRLEASVDPLPAPPGFVLKRGSGSPVERAVVFLAVLEQFGLLQDDSAALQGCLLFVPGRKKQPEFWACGVVPASDPSSLYLFDPRLGLPLPGPKGEGVATLKQAMDSGRAGGRWWWSRPDSDGVLEQLKVGDVAYDVTAERVRAAEAAVYAPLSALAPRMRLMQDHLLRDPVWRDADGNEHPLPPAVRVKLAEDEPGAIDAVRKAFVASGGAADGVRYWREGGRILRSFLRPEDGGADFKQQLDPSKVKGFAGAGKKGKEKEALRFARVNLLQYYSVPWQDFPEALRRHEQLAFDAGPGAAVRNFFALPFVRWLAEPNSAREMVIRGQFTRAARELSQERETWDHAKSRGLSLEVIRQGPEALPEEVRDGIEAWVKRAFDVFAEQPVAQPGQVAVTPEVMKLFRWRLGEPMDRLMSGAIADARGAQVTFQLALCKHEQAARLQTRMELAARAGVKMAADEQKARQAWAQSGQSWKEYLDDYARQPGAAAARRMLGESRLGEGKPQEAKQVWTEAAKLTEDRAEKLALLWQAQQVK